MAAGDNFLSRWSRRKTEARQSQDRDPQTPATVAAPLPPAAPVAPQAGPERAEPAPLPPLEELTPESDFSPFMGKEVDAETRSKALKKLFADPHFNTMDMMDVYVDDYSKPDPLPDGWLEKMQQLSHLGDKAGRDREEAERLRAAEEARAPDAPAPAGVAGPLPEQAAPGPDPGNAAIPGPHAAEDAIPPRAEGESGT